VHSGRPFRTSSVTTGRLTATSIHVRSVELNAARATGGGFPFSVPAIRTLPRLEFNAPVTCFVGDNGSGKSTLLEAIALAARLPAVGSAELERDETLVQQRLLAGALRLSWHKRVHRGFFLRAEDFFGFARRIAQLRVELQQRIGDVEKEYADASAYTRGLAMGPAAGSLAELTQRYGENVDARSHGEAFLALFQSRLTPGGLYLLDEPEAALSPQSQLGLIALLADSIPNRCQFIIATHSPLLLAFPGATIYSFDVAPIQEVRYDELQHVNLTRDFLNDPTTYLRHLVPDSVKERVT
jgi:predicted ATPase